MVAAIALSSTWCWDDVGVSADGYRLYWGYTGQSWLAENSVEVDRFFACTGNECSVDIDEDAIPGTLVFFVVTAFNSVGESSTEHGPVEVLP